DIVQVKDGYARNYLLPQDLAEIATQGALKNREKNLVRIKAKSEKLHNETLHKAEIIKSLEKLEIEAKAGESGKLFGAVTTRKLAEIIKDKTSIDVDRRTISLNNPINLIGEYKMSIKLTSKVSVELPIEVVVSEIIKEEKLSKKLKEEIEGTTEEKVEIKEETETKVETEEKTEIKEEIKEEVEN
ncbi:MAG: 50S ribosomal protein L9, partial [Candidatus Aenigmarchaeota archaeon]|nr:50S ribosomal protein L9 [Candidatus Aenigmarchaeota archaeon]